MTEVMKLAQEFVKYLEFSQKSNKPDTGGKDLLSGLRASAPALKKDVATGHTGTLLHGPGGLFNTPGLDNAVISTHVRARGLGSVLQAFPSVDTNPYFGFLTGFSDDQGGEPTYACDDAPTGYIKSGTLTARFGKVSRDTNTIEISETINRINRGDMTDLMLVGSLLSDENSGVLMPADVDQSNVLNLVVAAEQVSAGIRLERKLAKMLWTGDVSVKTLGGYAEFPGLESQMVAGQVDAETNIALPSADATIINVNYQQIGGGTFDLVEPIEEAEDFVYDLAQATGMDPLTGVVVMHPMLWRSVSSAWPIQYNTQPDYGIIAGTNVRVITDARMNVQDRDAMRNGLYIDINGRRYPVVLDNNIPLEDSSTNAGLGLGEYASSINFVPLTAVGMPITYWQYKDYSMINTQSAPLPANLVNWATDGGRFLWSQDGQYTCFRLKATTEPRVVLRAPHLTWRVIRVQFSRQNAPHAASDAASSYWRNGGPSLRTSAGPTQYSVWL